MNILKRSFVIITICIVLVILVKSIETNDDLRKTLVTSHMEVPIQTDQNIIYSSTFQIAWSRLKNNVIKEDIKVEKPVAIVPFLNKGLATEADISEKDYLAMAGFVRDDIVGKINRDLKRKFGFDAHLLDATQYDDPDIILAYAFLNKNLRFENPFEDFKHPITFYTESGREEIEGFGIHKYSSKPEHKNIKKQVEILHYENQKNFIIRLNSKSIDDEIILAKIAPGKTVLKTFEKVNSKISGCRPMYLEKNDILQMPKFNLALLHSYSSLLGVHLVNKGFEDYFFYEATQNINFKLDETGAKVKSESKIALKKGPPINFKLLIFNSPFLLYIKKKDGKYPYLAMWIEDTELMVKS